MSHYVDGFVLPVPKRNVDAYRRMASKAAGIFREHGALEYKECIGDKVNAKILKDPRIQALCDPRQMPFDCKRMLYGGFKTIVEA
jgi:uncharacterized protein YbaA (DUF1428 family)